jgi:glycosyltransferase involved in cell wall biosynthesis
MASIRCSVVMSVRDEDSKLLREAVASILAQDMPEFELIVVDDGSQNPLTMDVLVAAGHCDRRIRIIHQNATGLASALNLGISMAKSCLIVRHDSDDWSSSERLSLLLASFDVQQDLVLVGSNWGAYSDNGRHLWNVSLPLAHEEIVASLPFRNPFCHGSAAFRLPAFQKIGGYRTAFERSQDYDLFWRLSEIGNVRNLEQVLYHRRFTSHSVTAKDPIGQIVSTRTILELARMRSAGQKENIAIAFANAAALTSENDRLNGRLQEADALLLAGHFGRALKLYYSINLSKISFRAIMKMIRSLVFVVCPPFRPWLFGH